MRSIYGGILIININITNMNEKLNLVNILRYCPKGTKLYSVIHGEVLLDKVKVDDIYEYPILVTTKSGYSDKFTVDGKFYSRYNNSECLLFPSYDQRDWSKFNNKFDYSKMKLYDEVLVRNSDVGIWRYKRLFSMNDNKMVCTDVVHGKSIKSRLSEWSQGVPYIHNMHLLSTTDYPSNEYIWWND